MTEEVEFVEMPPDLSRNVWGLVAFGTMAVLTGAVIGYALGVKRTTLKYEKILEEQVREAKEYYAKLYKGDEFSTPESAARSLGVEVPDPVPDEVTAAMAEYSGEPPAEVNVNLNVNVFGGASDWDQQQEESKRNAHPLDPYVVSKDEFNANDPGYNQISVTYFAEDDTLIDDKNEVIPDVENTVGADNLNRFGHGSGDNRVVYIRNDTLEVDFEVVKSEGSYTKEVLGFDDRTLEHADRRARRPSRRTDE